MLERRDIVPIIFSLVAMVCYLVMYGISEWSAVNLKEEGCVTRISFDFEEYYMEDCNPFKAESKSTVVSLLSNLKFKVALFPSKSREIDLKDIDDDDCPWNSCGSWPDAAVPLIRLTWASLSLAMLGILMRFNWKRSRQMQMIWTAMKDSVHLACAVCAWVPIGSWMNQIHPDLCERFDDDCWYVGSFYAGIIAAMLWTVVCLLTLTESWQKWSNGTLYQFDGESPQAVLLHDNAPIHENHLNEI
eukprot:TRINITY_DN11838_c0_g1_i1.p1 TRINITY_DN11838_c0_g1~~TRINITY_DN11838_c0_g1_i1.p1  ORF type:complete len:245 (+),score=36.12 TRINITY_DN11838_c0_g1_i1:120-854(+)